MIPFWQNEAPKGLTATKIAIIYLVAGALWILLSDQLLNAVTSDHVLFLQLQTYKGWLFVLVTGLLLYGLIGRRELELKKSKEELKESERSIGTLLGNLPGIAYRCKADRLWTMEFISEGCLAITGYCPNDLLMNQKIAYVDLIHPDDREQMGIEVKKALNNKSSYQLTYRIRTKIGDEKWLWEQGCGVYDSNGNLEALEGFITDITQRMKGEERVKELHRELERTAIRTATLLCRAIDERDKSAAGHCTRLANLSVELGERLGLAPERLDQLRYAALLHDIGKVRVSETILNKPGKLNPEEWKEMQGHVEVGANLVSNIAKLKRAADIIFQHHERWDGQGYPKGLQSDEILLEARILSVVDSFDAMINERPYRGPMAPEEALRELQKHSGKQWDPQVVESFHTMLQQPSHWTGGRPMQESDELPNPNISEEVYRA